MYPRVVVGVWEMIKEVNWGCDIRDMVGFIVRGIGHVLRLRNIMGCMSVVEQ